MSSDKQMSAMPRFRSNSLVAYNAALSGQGSDHGWWLCLSMLEAGWIFNGLLWLGYAWNPGIDSVRCEFERKFVIWQTFFSPIRPRQSSLGNNEQQTQWRNRTQPIQESDGIRWNVMESDDKPPLHDLIWLRKPLPQNAGMIQDLGSRADVVTCGTVWIPSIIGDHRWMQHGIGIGVIGHHPGLIL